MTADLAVVFTEVKKSYPRYHHITGGIKNFLFDLFRSIRGMKEKHTVLSGIDLSIPRGSSFGIVGRNGAGKSTILGLTAGVLVPDSGTVEVKGRMSPLLELGAGFHSDLSGRENILLNGILLGNTKATVLDSMDDIIEFSELANFIDQPVRTYSSGMYARLGFSIIASLSPEILIIDEVLSVGDQSFSDKCLAAFDRFREDPEVTILFVSHNLESVVKICDRVAWIEDGRIRMLGDAADVIDCYSTSFD